MREIYTHHRWYDQDPTVSIAVSILRNTPPENQKFVVDFLIEKGKKHKLTINISQKRWKRFFKRWYDSDDRLHQAIEYMRVAPPELQKEMAIEIINYLCHLEPPLGNRA